MMRIHLLLHTCSVHILVRQQIKCWPDTAKIASGLMQSTENLLTGGNTWFPLYGCSSDGASGKLSGFDSAIMVSMLLRLIEALMTGHFVRQLWP